MKEALRIFADELAAIEAAGTKKDERIITTPQSARIDTTRAKHVLNLCANNYLGLSDNAELIAAAKASYDQWGFGLSSVRFICGTQSIHKQLEHKPVSYTHLIGKNSLSSNSSVPIEGQPKAIASYLSLIHI